METPFNSTADIGRSTDKSVSSSSRPATSASRQESNPKKQQEENVSNLTPQQQRLQQMIALQRAQQNQLQLQMQNSNMTTNPATGLTGFRRPNSGAKTELSNLPYHNSLGQVHPEETVVIHHQADGQLNNEEVSGVTTSTMGEEDFSTVGREPFGVGHHRKQEEEYVDAGMHSMDFTSGRGNENDYNRMIQRNNIPNYGATNMLSSNIAQSAPIYNNNNNSVQQTTNPYMMMMSVEEQTGNSTGGYSDQISPTNNSNTVPSEMPNNHTVESKKFSSEQQQQQQQQQIPHQYDYRVPYENKYKNTDYDDDPYAEFEAEYGYDCMKGGCCGSNDESDENSGWCQCFSNFFQAENLHRSICFGAIDGMLTGSGIVAACYGLGWFSAKNSTTATLALTALSLSACTSDGICMAIGHVWSNYVLTQSSIKERAEQRSRFDTHRSEAKAKLVDLLLMRGMLKIDAMSIADTLEGYPDIFVNAIVGDGVTSGIVNSSNSNLPTLSRGSSSFSGHENNFYGHNGGTLGLARNNSYGDGQSGGGGHGYSNLDTNHPHHVHPPPPQRGILRNPSYTSSIRSEGNSNLPPANTGFSSFGAANHHFWANTDYDEDPDEVELNTAVMEGWHEGIFMMLAFCSFSILPSLIFSYVPHIFMSSNHQQFNPYNLSYKNYYNEPYYSAANNTYSNIISISILSVIMICLGIWKSQFFQSSWIIFGIETVLVLYLSLGTAYGLGHILSVYVR